MLKTLVFMFLAVVVTAFVAEYYAYQNTKKITHKHRLEISNLKRDKLELETLKNSTDQELNRAQFYLKELENWKAKAIQCYPEIDNLVRISLAEKEAKAFLSNYPNIDSIEATYTNYPLLVGALEAFCKLSDEAQMQTYITVETLKNKRDEAFADYVSTTTNYLQNADKKLQGIPEHLPQLSKIMEWFNNIPVIVRAEISGTVIISLSLKEARAKYLAGIAVEQIPEDLVTEYSPRLSKFFDAISNTLNSIKTKCSAWCSKKYSDLRTWMTKPFEVQYTDGEDESFEDDLDSSPPASNTESDVSEEKNDSATGKDV